MRFKALAIFMIAFVLVVCGCEKSTDDGMNGSIPTLSEKFVAVSESDLNGSYSMPIFRNFSNEAVQAEINVATLDFSSVNSVRTRKNKAVGFLAGTDLTDYIFSEHGTYKVHCNDGKYISFSLSFEQRFVNGDKYEFVRQNYVLNYDTASGEAVDASSLFVNRDEVSEYIAKKLYERLLNMNCLETGVYSDEVFSYDVLEYCAVMPNNRVAVVTTSGLFDLKLSAGAPVVEISIPAEYYLTTK